MVEVVYGTKIFRDFKSNNDPEYKLWLREVEKEKNDDYKYFNYVILIIIGFIVFMIFNDIANLNLNSYKSLSPLLNYLEYLSPILNYLK